MKEKKTTKRLLPMMDTEDLFGLFDIDNRMTLMRRRRDGGTSEKTNPWEDFDEKEGINTLLYIYEMRTGPQLQLQGKVVMTYSRDGEELDSRSLEYVRTVSMLARKYKGKRKEAPLMLDNNDDAVKEFAGEKELDIVWNNESYDVELFPNGQVKVGCQPFPWTEIDAFAKKMGWWK